MSSNGAFDFTGSTDFDNSNLGHDNSSTVDGLFDAFNREGDAGLDLHTRKYASVSTQTNDSHLYPSNISSTDFLTTAGPSTLPAVHPSPPHEKRESLSYIYTNRRAHHS